MPKRKTFEAPGEVSVGTTPAVLFCAKSRIDPSPIPTRTEGGRPCVATNTTDIWLRKAVGDRARGDPHLVTKQFVEELCKALDNPQKNVEEARASHDAQGVDIAPRGRDAMGLGDDSEEEMLVESRLPRAPSKRSQEPE